MRALLDQLLGERQPFSGLAAWGALLPDRTVAGHCYSDWFAAPQIEHIMGRLALAAESLTHHGIAPRRMSWVFEHARVWLAMRPDGACLALFVENRPDLPRSELDRVLDAFTRFP
jgi:hypothetical protein